MGFSRQEYWSGLPFPSPGNLPNPGIEPASFACPALAGGFFATSTTWEALCLVTLHLTLCDPIDCSPPGSSVHRDSPGKNIGEGCYALLQGNLPNPGIEPGSPTFQVDSLLT